MYKAPSKTRLYHGISISLHNHKKSWQKSLYVFSANFHIHARINAVVKPSLFLLCVFFCCVFFFRLRCAEINDCSLQLFYFLTMMITDSLS